MPKSDISGLWLPDSVEFTDEEQQERQQERDKYYQMGKEIAALYRDDPALTIPQVVEKIEGAEYNDVVFVLNEFAPQEDWTVKYLGPGQGHGWIQESVRQTLVENIPADPKHIGHRWPDGSLREDPFDDTNDSHLAEMGLSR